MKSRRTRRARRWVAVLGAATLALAACGGDDEAAVGDIAEDVGDTGTEIVEEDTQAEAMATEQDTAGDTGPTGDDVEVETGQDVATEGDAATTGAYSAELDALNGSNAEGTATIAQESEGTVTVTVTTTGVSANLPHAQHIHIGGSNECPPQDAAGDDDLISTPEGQEFYGEIKVSLTTEGDVSPKSALAVERFPVASEQGEVSYERTFDLPEGTTFDDLSNGVIVQHGIADTSLGSDPSTYDGPDSPLKEGVPQEATLPTLCGPLQFGGGNGN